MRTRQFILAAILALAAVPGLAAPAGGRPAAAAAAPPVPVYKDALIKDVPHVRQKPDFCGEACAEMALGRLGRPVTQDDVFNAAGLDPALGRGCYTRELAAALERIGFKAIDAFHRIVVARAEQDIEQQWAEMHADLVRGVPSIVCMHFDDRPKTTEHFRLIVGYDRKADEVLYHEPATDGGAYRRMTRPQLLALWPLKGSPPSPQAWTVVRLALDPGTWRELPRRAGGFAPADVAQHVRTLRGRMPPGFALVLAPPFVVLGDEPPEAVRGRAEGTVRWAVDRLKAAYFRKDPDEIIDIWLFKDKASYEKHARQLFNDTPTTPYGYYSAEHRALIMNIATGGGTLVHEIVHPFMRANFPECPAWFNEGMGSLYEQCDGRRERIAGLTNWRLAGLQKAVREGRLPPFERLAATTDAEFYNHDKGTNYAQARYLCYYLQEKGLLEKFYHAFVAAHKADPTGYKTLQAVLGEKDMAAFQKRWEAYVLGLVF